MVTLKGVLAELYKERNNRKEEVFNADSVMSYVDYTVSLRIFRTSRSTFLFLF